MSGEKNPFSDWAEDPPPVIRPPEKVESRVRSRPVSLKTTREKPDSFSGVHNSKPMFQSSHFEVMDDVFCDPWHDERDAACLKAFKNFFKGLP